MQPKELDRNPQIQTSRPQFQELTEERRSQFDSIMGGMEIVRLDDPFKTADSGIWHVPGTITGSLGIKEGDALPQLSDLSIARNKRILGHVLGIMGTAQHTQTG
jgi:hypothetical protein